MTNSEDFLPTHAFGMEFTHIPEHVRQDLETLQREAAIYSDMWIDEIDDFRHVQISFTQDECADYARRSWAYELYLRAGQPELARDVSGIPADIADYADNYELVTRDGAVLAAPYHCFAAFLGSHLELLTCSNIRAVVIEMSGRTGILFQVRRAIESLTATIRSFNSRENGLVTWSITCEDDVRDLMYVMLRPILFDLGKEEAVPSRAGTHKFVDLFSHGAAVFIEVKWISKKNQWKRIVDQIHVDVQCYVSHPACKTLIVIIVDHARDIPDPRKLEKELTCRQRINDKDIDVQVYVCEP